MDFGTWVRDNRRLIAIDLAAGSFSGMCNCLSSHPLDTIKVRMQMSTDGIYTTVNKILLKEGPLALYKGMLFPLTSVPVLNAVVFSTYEFWKRFFTVDGKMTYSQTAFCGAMAGSAASLFSCPIELTKCKLQMQTNNVQKMYKGPWDCLYKIMKTEGFKGVFRAMHVTQQREILGYGAQFSTYEALKDFLLTLKDQSEPDHLDLLLAGGMGGVACWFIGYPQDTIKTILQCESGRDRRFKAVLYDGGFYNCAKHVISTDGVLALWKGFSVCMFRAFYANAIAFYSYETAKSFINTY